MLLRAVRRLHAHFAGLEQREQRRVARRDAELALLPGANTMDAAPEKILPRR
jgi:hypothetical protein